APALAGLAVGALAARRRVRGPGHTPQGRARAHRGGGERRPVPARRGHRRRGHHLAGPRRRGPRADLPLPRRGAPMTAVTPPPPPGAAAPPPPTGPGAWSVTWHGVRTVAVLELRQRVSSTRWVVSL